MKVMKRSHRAAYDFDIWRTTDGAEVLVITDLGGDKSVTNDAEHVLAECKGFLGGHLPAVAVYKDSEGTYDGLDHINGAFKGFYSLNEKNVSTACEKALKLAADRAAKAQAALSS